MKFFIANYEKGVDTDGNGKINSDEAEEITVLDVSDLNISDLTGIEAFINLIDLRCWSNQLIHLDVSNNTSLRTLGIRGMPSLTEVCVWEMPITTPLDVFADDSPNFYFTTDCSK
jgi:Leucine-rich repeat (LRR) protein